MRRVFRLLPALVFCFVAGTAAALPLNIEVPDNALIEFNGLEWAWAAPCNPIEPSCGIIDLSFQGAFGWHIPTTDEFLLAPSATDFVFDGANVPLGGVSPNGASFSAVSNLPPGDAACAAVFFSTLHSHCDYGNAPGSGEPNELPGWGGQGLSGANEWGTEALVVRSVTAIPEPTAFLVFGLGSLVIGTRIRRRRG